MSRNIPRDLVQTWLSNDEDLDEIASIIGNIPMVAVESSNLAMVGYDRRRYLLQIAFLDGSVYVYEGVPPEEYVGLMEAGSHGEYFYDNIRMVYRFERTVG